jgi:uncharacterized protein
VQRVVVDTNVWVSAVLNPAGHPARVLEALRARRFILLVSQPMLDELRDVLRRPRLTRKYGITAADVHEVILLLRGRATEVTISGTVRICRDPDDDVVIETAVVGQANALVTRDDDMKGADELSAALAAVGIAVSSVQHFLDTLDTECLQQERLHQGAESVLERSGMTEDELSEALDLNQPVPDSGEERERT